MIRTIFRKIRSGVRFLPAVLAKKRRDRSPERWFYHFFRESSDDSVLQECLDANLLLPQIEAVRTLAAHARQKKWKDYESYLIRSSASEIPALPFEWKGEAFLAKERAAAARALKKAISGKRVIVVGPADYSAGLGRGSFVESFDWVARINFQWPIPEPRKADLGSRMDILYHCCNGNYPVNLLFQDGFEKTKFVCAERNFGSLELKRYCAARAIPYLDYTDVHRRLTPSLGAFPSTGLVAVAHLLSFPIAELYVFGMTFWGTPYYPGYQGSGVEQHLKGGRSGILWHHPDEEVLYLKRLAKKEPRLHIDEKAGLI